MRVKNFILPFITFMLLTLLVISPAAQVEVGKVIAGIPRNEILIIENPEGRIPNPGWFNYWSSGGGGWSTGLQQAALDSLWFIDPDAGIEDTWINALAADRPIYNKDFTEMTVKLKEGIYWSDGVPFTADDVIFTVKTLAAHPEMNWGGYFSTLVKNVYKTDNYTVVFELTKPNSRFHTIFTVRWSACAIMPKHVFEKKDPVKFDFNPPTSIGPYVLKSYDPTGDWYLWERRADWQRTSMGMDFGMPQPKYLLYVNPGPSEKRVLAQIKHQLDVIHDVAPEGVVTLKKQNRYACTWFDDFPWAHPDPTLPSIILNHEKYPLGIKEVRWALTLAINIVDVSLASYNGAATISPIHVPPTGKYLEWYFDPIESWLLNYKIKIGKESFAVYDSNIPFKIAQAVKQKFGFDVPTDKNEIKQSLGYGWWKYAPNVAEKLLVNKGFKKVSGKWLLPNGKPWKITILTEGESRPIMTRAAANIAEQWRKFGIDAKIEVAEMVSFWGQRLPYGDFDAAMGWNIETWGGHPDLFWFLESWHSEYYRPTGQPVVAKNLMRWKNKQLDTIVTSLRGLDFDDPKCLELGLDFVKLCVDEMPIIPIMSYNVFTVCDEYYWTGFPTAKNPYANPVPNWSNSKYMFVMIKPTGRK